jgi:hypothetical protein
MNLSKCTSLINPWLWIGKKDVFGHDFCVHSHLPPQLSRFNSFYKVVVIYEGSVPINHGFIPWTG